MRAGSSAPVIMLTARGEETDRVVGLELGADDYVTKPFSPREVVARVQAVLRRMQRVADDDPALAVLEFGSLVIDGARREVTVRDAPARLARKEFDLLAYLARRPGVTLTRTRLLEDVWDFAWDGDTATSRFTSDA